MKMYIYKRNVAEQELVDVLEVENPKRTKFTKSVTEARYTVIKARCNEVNADAIKTRMVGIVETKNNKKIVVFVMNVKVDYLDPKRCELTLAIGSDGLDEKIPLTTAATQNEITTILTDTYRLLYQTDVEDVITLTGGTEDGYIRNTDSHLPYAQCLRQLLNQGFKEIVMINENDFNISYIKDEKEYEIVLEDTIRAEVTMATDSLTKYIIINEEDQTQFLVSYLYSDGSIGTDVNQLIQAENVLADSEIVPIDDFNQEYCDNALREQSYQNNIEIDVKIDSYIFKHIFEEFIFDSLGNKVNIKLKDGTMVPSSITEIILKDNMATIVFGISKKRFMSKVAGKE